MQYEVTIGIPVYKAVDYIEKTMESVLSQTFQSIEFIIIDDCGNDGSMNVIERLQWEHPRGDSIHVIHNNKNIGVGLSRNKIIDNAQGKYLYFLDSDDLIEPETIQILYDAVVNNHAQVAYASYEIIDCVNNISPQIYQKPFMLLTGREELATYVFKYNHIFHSSACNILFDLELLRNTGIRFLDISFWEDMAFTTELATKVRRAVLLPNITYHYMIRSNSLSHYQQFTQINKNEILNIVHVLNYLKQKSKQLMGKTYLPFLCYNLEMNSFYAACYILKNHQVIIPKIRYYEIKEILHHPMNLMCILRFHDKRLSNLFFWFLGILYVPFLIPAIWLCGKLKKAL